MILQTNNNHPVELSAITDPPGNTAITRKVVPCHGKSVKVLLVHNRYQHGGGEDAVLASEEELLASNGHSCKLALLSNKIVHGFTAKILAAMKVQWSAKGYDFVSQTTSRFHPDIVHVHNFFPLLTPSIYDACIDAGVPVVQTLHNYRTICPSALLMRDGKICEKCVTGSPYQSILHRCYRNSVPGSCAVARMVAYHRKRKTWQTKVDRFIALTEFAKTKFVESGFPEEKIAVKPNFYTNEEKGIRSEELVDERQGALFVGRISHEKGIATLLQAWQELDVPLRIAGDGPLHDTVHKNGNSAVFPLGGLNADQVSREMVQAAFLVMPSEWYEGFPMVLVEAFAHGLPLVASRLGSMAEIVEDGVTGLHFEPGNPQDLAAKVFWMHHHPMECRRMGGNARRVYEEKYTPGKNYEMLMDIYQQAIAEHKAKKK